MSGSAKVADLSAISTTTVFRNVTIGDDFCPLHTIQDMTVTLVANRTALLRQDGGPWEEQCCVKDPIDCRSQCEIDLCNEEQRECQERRDCDNNIIETPPIPNPRNCDEEGLGVAAQERLRQCVEPFLQENANNTVAPWNAVITITYTDEEVADIRAQLNDPNYVVTAPTPLAIECRRGEAYAPLCEAELERILDDFINNCFADITTDVTFGNERCQINYKNLRAIKCKFFGVPRTCPVN